ncbi:energy transducer TonB [Parashewanella curva]|uniref:Protein TonB n=1 Tax=Parashewanella curva TaxID=2338552 RepID=A0A3L8Q2W1_9GAMM|nr:energy transducer TonB [Parashewanella curva]RLV61283.1 energy transducer TonB [Parashewanella curva]
MKTWTKTACALAILAISQTAYAEEAPQSQRELFNQAYSQYKEAIAERKNFNAVKFAKQSYLLGKVLYKDSPKDLAALTVNYATSLSNIRQSDKKKRKVTHKKAKALFDEALTIYQGIKPAQTTAIIDTHLKKAKVMPTTGGTKDEIEKALELAEKNGDEVFVAKVKMLAFDTLNRGKYTRHLRGLTIEALDTFQEKLPENAIDRVMAEFNVARIYQDEKKSNKAEKLYLNVIKQFDTLDYSHPFKLGAHSRLISIYEKRGDSDKSTEHCIAIGKMKPWQEDQDPVPLYRTALDYPTNYAMLGKEGHVVLSFTISKSGTVKDIEVLQSEGGRKFEKSAKKMLAEWRYAPKFENGEAVDAKNMKIRLDFTLG